VGPNRIDVEKSAYHHQSQNEAVIWNFAYLQDCQKPAVPLSTVVPFLRESIAA
jgi:hypothetical protein